MRFKRIFFLMIAFAISVRITPSLASEITSFAKLQKSPGYLGFVRKGEGVTFLKYDKEKSIVWFTVDSQPELGQAFTTQSFFSSAVDEEISYRLSSNVGAYFFLKHNLYLEGAR